MLKTKQNNDQNINRVFTKMSDNFAGQNNNAKISNSEENADFLDELSNRDTIDDINLTYDHMYASNTENGVLDAADEVNCQNAESEVTFFKDWLLFHLDLIQQQNDEILSKERTILLLKQENEKLKERLSLMERGSAYQTKYLNSHKTSGYLIENFVENMTQDSGLVEDNSDNVTLVGLNCDVVNNCEIELTEFEARHEFNEIERDNINVTSNNNEPPSQLLEVKTDQDVSQLVGIKSEVEPTDFNVCNNSLENLSNCNFTIHNSPESDSFKNLRMSIRRKRLCSNSSLVSNNDSASDDKNFRKSRKRRKHSVKSDKILTCNDQYVTNAGDTNLVSSEQQLAMEIAAAASNNLEVPHWRVKVYTSCYTMEGTENLDDEVYNRRHSRLENDERRRKRWDVQRIREQRIVDKLKQRQEKVSAGSQAEEAGEPVESLWPTLEDIRYLEICDELPVAAFGCPVPRAPYSDFSLPWINNPNITVKKTRKIMSRRNRTKR